MPVKHFIISPDRSEVSKDIIDANRLEWEMISRNAEKLFSEKTKKIINDEDNLVHVSGRIVVKVDMEFKNSHKFSDGTVIRLEREFNNFNRRHTQPVNCIVISGEDIPKDSEILVSHNALTESYRINDYKNSFEGEETDRIRYYSIPLHECFAWKDEDGNMRPMKDFQFGLRVYKPYEGKIVGIEPTKIENVIFVTTGKLKGSICHCLKSSDYSIIYQGDDGTEKELIRFRHSDDEEIEREELVCIDHGLTDKLENEELLIGLSQTTAKPLNESELFHYDRIY